MSIQSSKMTIGPLSGGGIVLSYRCSSRCQHCLYGCSPKRGEEDPQVAWIDPLLDLLLERGQRARYHIGGGEPFLDFNLLCAVVEGMTSRDLQLDYVETNASWVKSREQTKKRLQELRRLGLRCLLVSLSPFHAEYIPLRRTMMLIDVANTLLPEGAFVWLPEFADDLKRTDENQRLDLDQHLATRGEHYARGLAARYHLVLAGRAGRTMWRYGERKPWQRVARDAPCRRRLIDTSHFHVDLRGRYVPGLCPGLVYPFEHVPGTIDTKCFPLLQALYQSGPGALVDIAQADGFCPNESYSSACDLCTHVRCFLFQDSRSKNINYRELGPSGFYQELSEEYTLTYLTDE